MSEILATALEDARSRLTSSVEEAEAELRRARARAKELRMSLAMARELAGMGAGIETSVREVAPPRSPRPGRARLDLTKHATPNTPWLSVRRRAALEGLRRGRLPARVRSSFSPDVILRWDGDTPLAGTYRGRKEALALLELVLRQIDPTVDPQARIRADGDGFRVDARPGLHGEPRLRLTLVVGVRFDDRDRIDRLSVTPEEGDALDRLVDGVLA